MYKISEQLSYRQTGFFSKIISDYVDQHEALRSFYQFTPNEDGVKEAIEKRRTFKTDRKLLVNVLRAQYAIADTSSQVKKNIELLSSPDTFTLCTAHQPNIFTGHLYFIYKILHIIKLAEHLKKRIPGNNFVPVFYMGSEDADLEELGHIFINGQKYEWRTKQTGAVGRMTVDEDFINLIDQISGQLTIFPYGVELLQLIRNCYVKDTTIQEATFRLINYLFNDYGLIVLIPDNADLKRSMLSIFEDDIFNNTPSEIVSKTGEQLSNLYKVQAHPREINLFYLQDGLRNRLIKKDNLYYVEDSNIHFTQEEIKAELHSHPERFSPNVILRGLYQEIILPNVAFIGGGGELAYWLELKDLFLHYNIPYPVLLLRNSFILIDKKAKALCEKLKIGVPDLFKPENTLINELVKKESTHQLYLSLEKQQVKEVYDEIKKVVGQIDTTLIAHTEALMTKASKGLDALEKKMLKAEKRKFDTQASQIKKIKSILFPGGELQERIENFMPYYAKFGKDFISSLYNHSFIFEHQFRLLIQEDN
jgi:bacillithiol biosynthesis cysteine-adding enzyme BshC